MTHWNTHKQVSGTNNQEFCKHVSGTTTTCRSVRPCTAHLEVTVAQLASKGSKQGALARAWGAQQQGHAPWGNAATELIQDDELALLDIQEVKSLKQALQFEQASCGVYSPQHS